MIKGTPTDDAPLVIRRPIVRLARGLITPKLSASILEAIRNHVPPAHVADLLPRWNARDPEGPWHPFNAELTRAYAGIMAAAGRAASARVRKAVDFELDPSARHRRVAEIAVDLNPYSAKWIKGHGGELCVELSRQQHASVRDIVKRGYDRGDRPERMAEQLKRVVGLTSRQERAVDSFWVRTLEDTGDEAEADRLSDLYADRQLAYRVENVSRTENRYAVEEGRRDEWLQAEEDGEMPAGARRRWEAMPASHRLCEACEEMDGQEVGLDEQFESDELETSVDAPPLHPQCRCTQSLVFD